MFNKIDDNLIISLILQMIMKEYKSYILIVMNARIIYVPMWLKNKRFISFHIGR